MQLVVFEEVTRYNARMPAEPKVKTFTIQSEPKNLQPLLRGELAPLLKQAGFEEKFLESILVAAGEGITNCIRHSYQNEPNHPVEVTFEETPDQVTLKIRDYGQAIDLERVKAKENPKLPPDTPGGLGIYFMKTIMDSVEYNTAHSKGNELILIKKKQGAAS